VGIQDCKKNISSRVFSGDHSELLLLSSGENKLRWGFRTARKIFLRKLWRNFSGGHPGPQGKYFLEKFLR
jgi:hypothetical protein